MTFNRPTTLSSPEFITLAPTLLVGNYLEMSLTADRTSELWRNFLTRRHEIPGRLNTRTINMRIYGPEYFRRFDPGTPFQKWAVVEAQAVSAIPAGFESYQLEGGSYAVFRYKGIASQAGEIFRYIYRQWLPSSGYELDHRPHLDFMADNYRPDDPNAEEDLLIPVIKRL